MMAVTAYEPGLFCHKAAVRIDRRPDAADGPARDGGHTGIGLTGATVSNRTTSPVRARVVFGAIDNSRTGFLTMSIVVVALTVPTDAWIVAVPMA